MNTRPVKTIDEYIAGFPPDVKIILAKLRKVVNASAPGAQESLSYGMPAFKLNGQPIAYFAAWKNHIGFYPNLPAFKAELAEYETSKGTIKFPLDQPIPYPLIAKMVKFRVNEAIAREK